MSFTIGLLLGALALYFHFLRVEPKVDDWGGLTIDVPAVVWGVDFLRAGVCLLPLLVVWGNGSLDGNSPLTTLALSLLASPLLWPSAMKPGAGDARSFWGYTGKWLIYKLDVFIKSAGANLLVWLLIWLLVKVSILPDQTWVQTWLVRSFGFVTPLDGHIVMPFSFYLVAVMMVIVRSMILGIKSPIFFLYGLVLGASGILVFLNISLRTTLGNPGNPIIGFLAAVAWALAFAYLLAKGDKRSKRKHHNQNRAAAG